MSSKILGTFFVAIAILFGVSSSSISMRHRSDDDYRSKVPTKQPRAPLSRAPTSEPSSAPSAIPSVPPSTIPTVRPSASPSVDPTSKPSSAPSSVPSAIPSTSPSTIPSAAPSTIPSATPSTVPSAAPSTVPSAAPSTIPTATPTALPSIFPSAAPSVAPTFEPSSSPTDPCLGLTPVVIKDFSRSPQGLTIFLTTVNDQSGLYILKTLYRDLSACIVLQCGLAAQFLELFPGLPLLPAGGNYISSAVSANAFEPIQAAVLDSDGFIYVSSENGFIKSLESFPNLKAIEFSPTGSASLFLGGSGGIAEVLLDDLTTTFEPTEQPSNNPSSKPSKKPYMKRSKTPSKTPGCPRNDD